MAKQIKFSDDARQRIFAWIEKVAKVVIITMWPKWRNVILDKGYGSPQITNDGVTIAKEIDLEDKFESLWAELVKESAEKTNKLAWDGTTTATLLTYALAKEWLRYIKNWVSSVELKNGMKKAGEKINEELIKNAKIINTREEIEQVATISAQDEEIGKIIAQAMDKVGNNWVITVEESQTFGLDVEITDGMQFEQGYMSPYMITNAEKMDASMKDAPILITDGKISNMKDLLPLLEQLMQSGRKDLVIIAEDIDSEALTTIILNKLKWVLNVLGIKAPGFGDRKKEMLTDIAVLVWANVITSELGMKLENATLEDLWHASNVIATKDKTIIVWWEWDAKDIRERVLMIQKQIESSTSDYDKEKMMERVAKLAWGVAVIKVGAASEVEMKEKKLRIEDALNATKAAVEEWVVAWGWVALLKASLILEGMDLWNEDQNTWVSIVKQALSYPIRQIVENAGKEWSVIINKIIEEKSINYGYNAANDRYVDMIETWIIDPKKVERVALEQAISLAWMFLTTEAAVTEIPKKDDGSTWNLNSWMWGMWGMPWMWGMY